MTLSRRLSAVASMVAHCDTFYDIGTDHGQLPAFLLKEGRCRRAVATDISAHSLEKAKGLFARLGLAGCFHVGNGLEGLAPQQEDCVAVCGMGARAILDILPENLRCRCVLSTHVDLEALRIGLNRKGYRILREMLVQEGRRFYAVMSVQAGPDRPYRGAEAYIGRGLVGDPLLCAYLDWKERVALAAARGGDPIWKRRLGYIEEARAWKA